MQGVHFICPAFYPAVILNNPTDLCYSKIKSFGDVLPTRRSKICRIL